MGLLASAPTATQPSTVAATGAASNIPGLTPASMVMDAVADRAHALIAEWKAGEKGAADKLLQLLGATAPQVPHVPAGDRPALPAWAS